MMHTVMLLGAPNWGLAILDKLCSLMWGSAQVCCCMGPMSSCAVPNRGRVWSMALMTLWSTTCCWGLGWDKDHGHLWCRCGGGFYICAGAEPEE